MSGPVTGNREERFRPTDSESLRSNFQRDRDRVLYAPQFRRLSGVTQVASAVMGDVFHNRLTHSLKVAQIGRRLAERLLGEDPELGEVLDADVVETAGLAHDIGHPPFGHDGERVICDALDLDRFAGGFEGAHGFEGNAQSFRVLTRLTSHAENSRDDLSPGEELGLNLTRASLNAVLKYPWMRGHPGKNPKKWGAYRDDEERFAWVRLGQLGTEPGLEAALMDWADDVTYAVHDLMDFYRAGLIPAHLLSKSKAEREWFVSKVSSSTLRCRYSACELERMLESVLYPLKGLIRPHHGGRDQQQIIDSATSALITQFVSAVSICNGSSVQIRSDTRDQVKLLQQTTNVFVIEDPRIVRIREGQREMLKALFGFYMDVVNGSRSKALLPEAIRERLGNGDYPSRIVADLLAGMTERQVIQTYQQFRGIRPNQPITSSWLV